MTDRRKDVQEQGADTGKRFLFFGARHPVITIILILAAIIAIYMISMISSCGALATAGLGVAAGMEESQGGYSGGSGEDFANATETQQRIVEACHRTAWPGAGLCATWVHFAYDNAGFPGVGGNANDMWRNYCYSNDTSELEVGMIIAVEHSGPTGDSWTYGHVGIYIGDDTVMHSTGSGVVTCTLEQWVASFDPYNTVKWGYPPEVRTLVENEKRTERNSARQIPAMYNGMHVGYIWDQAFGNRSDWMRTSPQYKINALWREKGSVSTNNVMTIGGKYLIATKEKFGDLGDWVTFYFDNGMKIECILYDIKGTESNATEWGHIETSVGNQIKVLEFYMEDAYASVPFMSTSNRVTGWVNHGRCEDIPASSTVWG